MKQILSKLFGFFKIVLFVISLGMVLYGVLITYNRLDKPFISSFPIFLPFILVLITIVISFFIKNKEDNLLFNFVSTIVFITIIVICVRSKFDSNMILYYKYKIGFNPTFFSDNLSLIEAMLYLLGISNILLIISSKFSVKTKRILEHQKEEIIEEL